MRNILRTNYDAIGPIAAGRDQLAKLHPSLRGNAGHSLGMTHQVADKPARQGQADPSSLRCVDAGKFDQPHVSPFSAALFWSDSMGAGPPLPRLIRRPGSTGQAAYSPSHARPINDTKLAGRPPPSGEKAFTQGEGMREQSETRLASTIGRKQASQPFLRQISLFIQTTGHTTAPQHYHKLIIIVPMSIGRTAAPPERGRKFSQNRLSIGQAQPPLPGATRETDGEGSERDYARVDSA